MNETFEKLEFDITGFKLKWYKTGCLIHKAAYSWLVFMRLISEIDFLFILYVIFPVQYNRKSYSESDNMSHYNLYKLHGFPGTASYVKVQYL